MNRRTFLQSGLLGTAGGLCSAPLLAASKPADRSKFSVAAVGGAGRNLAKAMTPPGAGEPCFLIDTGQREALPRFITLDLNLPHRYKDLKDHEVAKRIEASAEALVEELAASRPPALVLAGGLGGCVGSFALPGLAQGLAGRGIAVFAAVFLPFAFEGELRRERSDRALARLSTSCLSVSAVNNQWAANLAPSTTLSAWFDTANRLQADCLTSLAGSGLQRPMDL